MASGSIRYTIRQLLRSSAIRSSWQRGPMEGIGRECGRDKFSPRCNDRSKYPTSSRAAREKGGVLISPCSHTNGLSFGLTNYHPMSYMTYRQAPGYITLDSSTRNLVCPTLRLRAPKATVSFIGLLGVRSTDASSQRSTAYRTRSRLEPSKVRVSSRRSEPGGRTSNARTPSPTTPGPIMRWSSLSPTLRSCQAGFIWALGRG